jgi:hypothetical protein
MHQGEWHVSVAALVDGLVSECEEMGGIVDVGM